MPPKKKNFRESDTIKPAKAEKPRNDAVNLFNTWWGPSKRSVRRHKKKVVGQTASSGQFCETSTDDLTEECSTTPVTQDTPDPDRPSAPKFKCIPIEEVIDYQNWEKFFSETPLSSYFHPDAQVKNFELETEAFNSKITIAEASKLAFECFKSLDPDGRKILLPTLKTLFEESKIPWKTWDDISSQVPLQVKFYRVYPCPNCDKFLNLQFSCLGCEHVPAEEEREFFVVFDLRSYLCYFYSCLDFVELLQTNIPLAANPGPGFSDLYSGEKYKNLVAAGKLGKINQLSINLGYDGVKRGKGSPWPIFFNVNEIPICERFKTDNMFIAAVAFSKKHNSNHIFGALIHQLHDIQRNPPKAQFGIHTLPLQLSVIAVICDLQGKCKAMFHSQYNSYFGCYHCYSISHRVNNTQVYPFETENPQLRKGEHIASILEGLKKTPKKSFIGVKGYTVLWNIPDFQVYSDVGMEYMHQQFINTSCKAFQMMLNYNGYNFNMKEKSKEFKLLWMPTSMASMDLSLQDYEKFKAVHWKYFIIYWSVPLLFDDPDLPKSLSNHWLNFVKINVLLCAKWISESKLQELHQTCINYVKNHTAMFGDINATINIHNLLHCRNDIQRLGLMIGHSAFPFESEGGVFIRSIDGTQQYPRKAMIEYCKTLESRKNPSEIAIQQAEPKMKKFIDEKSGFTSFKSPVFVLAAEVKRIKDKLHIQGEIMVRSYDRVKNRNGITMETITAKDSHCYDDTGVQWMENGTNCYGRIKNIFLINHLTPPSKELYFEIQVYPKTKPLLHFAMHKNEPIEETFFQRPDDLKQVIVLLTIDRVFFCEDAADLVWSY